MTRVATTYAEILGRVIVAHRRKHAPRALRQNVLAAHCGLSQSGYSRLERGTAQMTIAHLYRTADALGTTGARLLAETERAAGRLRRRRVTVLATRGADSAGGVLWVAHDVICSAIVVEEQK